MKPTNSKSVLAFVILATALNLVSSSSSSNNEPQKTTDESIIHLILPKSMAKKLFSSTELLSFNPEIATSNSKELETGATDVNKVELPESVSSDSNGASQFLNSKSDPNSIANSSESSTSNGTEPSGNNAPLSAKNATNSESGSIQTEKRQVDTILKQTESSNSIEGSGSENAKINVTSSGQNSVNGDSSSTMTGESSSEAIVTGIKPSDSGVDNSITSKSSVDKTLNSLLQNSNPETTTTSTDENGKPCVCNRNSNASEQSSDIKANLSGSIQSETTNIMGPTKEKYLSSNVIEMPLEGSKTFNQINMNPDPIDELESSPVKETEPKKPKSYFANFITNSLPQVLRNSSNNSNDQSNPSELKSNFVDPKSEVSTLEVKDAKEPVKSESKEVEDQNKSDKSNSTNDEGFKENKIENNTIKPKYFSNPLTAMSSQYLTLEKFDADKNATNPKSTLDNNQENQSEGSNATDSSSNYIAANLNNEKFEVKEQEKRLNSSEPSSENQNQGNNENLKAIGGIQGSSLNPMNSFEGNGKPKATTDLKNKQAEQQNKSNLNEMVSYENQGSNDNENSKTTDEVKELPKGSNFNTMNWLKAKNTASTNKNVEVNGPIETQATSEPKKNWYNEFYKTKVGDPIQNGVDGDLAAPKTF